MVSDQKIIDDIELAFLSVLILVLMEDGLWHCLTELIWLWHKVLILVLMEDGLWPMTALRNEKVDGS